MFAVILMLCSTVGCSHALVSNEFNETITPAETSNIKEGAVKVRIKLKKLPDGKVVVEKIEEIE